MNPYIVNVTGKWPNESYTINVDKTVIDNRYVYLPIDLIFAPYYVEDNTYVNKNYFGNVGFNTELLQLSSNSFYILDPQTEEINVNLNNNLTFNWSPSSFRKGNYGNIFGSLMLKTENNKHHGLIIYPSQLFLYPQNIKKLNKSEITTSDLFFINLSSTTDLTNFFTTIKDISAGLSSSFLETPLITSFNYTVTSFISYQTSDINQWNDNTFALNFSNLLNFTSSINLNISSYSAYEKLSGIDSFVVDSLYFNFFNSTTALNNYYSGFTTFNKITSITYQTFIETFSNDSTYVLTTSSVLLSSTTFQFIDDFYAGIIKSNNNYYLSQKPNQFISFDNTNISNIKYGLSANITKCNHEVIKFSETNNPIYYSTLLEESVANIRPDTVKLAYDIQYFDHETNTIRNLGDIYDDFSINPDTSIEASYIFSQNNSNKLLTFQLLQSAVKNEPLETLGNCVLTAILDFDSCLLTYRNISDIINLDSLNFVYTPISGTPNSIFSIRYMADLPYISETETLNSSVCSISSPESFAIVLNSPLNVSTHNNLVDWHLKYPPYYYSFKNSYENSSFNYENINSLNFYLSSELVRTIKNITSDSIFEHYSEIDLYTSFYSDFDILELPLKDYGQYDYIKYSIENKSEFFDKTKIKAYILDCNDKTQTNTASILNSYDIINSPYIPAVSGTYLRIVYDLYNGGTFLTIKPSVSTKFGTIDSYWATTFPVALDYNPFDTLRKIKIQTLSQNITSTILSIAGLTGEASDYGLDLRNSNISWEIQSDDFNNLTVKNITPIGINSFNDIQNNEIYPFEYVNQLEILGSTDKTYTVTVTSYFYNTKKTIEISPIYFDRFAENNLFIEEFILDNKNKIKLLKLNCKTPVYNVLYNIRPETTILWKWDYNNIAENTPISAYLNLNNLNINSLEDFLNFKNLNQLFEYKESTISFGDIASSIYLLIDTDYTLTEQFFPLDVSVEIYDTGETIIGNKRIPINSYPDPSVFSTNFKVFYPNFQNIALLNTESDILSMTRPPNGTNYYTIVGSNINRANAAISGLSWKFDTTITPLSSLSSPYYISETINFTLNESGFYDNFISKDFNNYLYVTNLYKNMEYINGLTSVVLNQTDVDTLCSILNFNNLSLLSSTLVSLSSNENFSPLATSMNVITSSFYISAFETAEEYDFLNNINNLYSVFFYTSTVSIDRIVETEPSVFETIIAEFDLFCVNYILTSNAFIQTDDLNLINSFVLDNITTQTNILTTFTSVNKTTSFEYEIFENKLSQNLAYYEHEITFAAKNVSLLNWNNFYNFDVKGKIIIPTKIEFDSYPIIYNTPKLIWNPDWVLNTKDGLKTKKSNRYLTILNSFDTTKSQLTGKTYGNRLSCQEYNVSIQFVQEFQISENDPIEILFAVGNNELTFLREQLINDPSQYEIYGSDIRIKEFKFPCYPDMYEPEGMHVSVTAFNRFFPANGGLSYFGLSELSSSELSVFNYPITAQTYDRILGPDGLLIGNYVNANPKLYDYEPVKLLFYPEINKIDLDEKRIIKVKQIVEVDPINSPNLIEFDKSTVVYTLESEFWSVSALVPATSNSYIDLFTINVGDPLIPLTVSDYNVGSLTLTASALISTKITENTFKNYNSAQYTGDRNLWGSVYQFVIGNESQQPYKILFSEVNTITSETETISTYNVLSDNNDYILKI